MGLKVLKNEATNVLKVKIVQRWAMSREYNPQESTKAGNIVGPNA